MLLSRLDYCVGNVSTVFLFHAALSTIFQFFGWQGETDTIETWAETLNAQGLTPNSHCTIVYCGNVQDPNS